MNMYDISTNSINSSKSTIEIITQQQRSISINDRNGSSVYGISSSSKQAAVRTYLSSINSTQQQKHQWQYVYI